MKDFIVILMYLNLVLRGMEGHWRVSSGVVFTRFVHWKCAGKKQGYRKWEHWPIFCGNPCMIWWYDGVLDWFCSNVDGMIWTNSETEGKTSDDLVVNYILESWTRKNKSFRAPIFLPGHLGEWWCNSQSLDILITFRLILRFSVTMDWFLGSIPERRKLGLREFGWLAWHS